MPRERNVPCERAIVAECAGLTGYTSGMLGQAGWRALLDALRRDWAVQVLDAYDDMTGKQTRWEPFSHSKTRGEICPNNGIRYSGSLSSDSSREAARLEAAKAVWPELPQSVRADIGEKP